MRTAYITITIGQIRPTLTFFILLVFLRLCATLVLTADLYTAFYIQNPAWVPYQHNLLAISSALSILLIE